MKSINHLPSWTYDPVRHDGSRRVEPEAFFDACLHERRLLRIDKFDLVFAGVGAPDLVHGTLICLLVAAEEVCQAL